MEGQVVERKLAAIFAADVARYSHLMEQDETATLRALRASRAVLDRLITEHRGRIFTTAGDSVVADFASAVDAVSCALAVQRALAAENAERPEAERMLFRIGVHLGDVVVDGSNLLGDGVNIAARLEALAEPGGICVSGAVREQVGTKLPAAFVDLGGQRLKNIAQPLRVFEVYGSDTARPSGAGLARGSATRHWLGITGAAAAVVIAVGASLWWLWPALSVGVRSERPAASSETSSSGRATVTPRSGPAARLSIVVVPFANMSNDPDQEYFADGISEDLTTDLSRIAGMVVIARNSAFSYKGKPVDPKQIGRELGVRYVLQGSVRRAGKQVRINAELIDAETGAQLWAERFDRDIGDLFAVQNEITARIARALQSQLAIAEASRAIEHPDALDYLMRGRAQLVKPISRETYDEAVRDFETALALDPKVPDGAAYLATVLTVRVSDELSDFPDQDLQRARQLANQALAAAPSSAMAHYARAQVLRVENRCEEAIPEYRAAIAIDRSRAPAYAHIGWCRFLTGSLDEVIPDFDQAIHLSPHEPGIAPWYGRVGVVELLQSHVDEAIAALEHARSDNARLPFVHAYLAAAYALKGQEDRARAELSEAQQLSPAYGNLNEVTKSPWFANPTIRALAEKTYFPGLRKAGLPES